MIENNLFIDVIFYILSTIIICLSLLVIFIRDIFRASIALAGTFLNIAIIYFMLNAEFIGTVQILVYVGAISVLMAFAVMFLRSLSQSAKPSSYRPFSFFISVLIFISFVIGIYNTEWEQINNVNDEKIIEVLSEKYYELGHGEQIYITNDLSDSGLLEIENKGVFIDSTSVIGTFLVQEYLLAFQIVGLILVVGVVGGLIIMKEPYEDGNL
ncbi:MAG: NADH-quinone oxidoreductase subunit J [Dehalococcoidia bacterium]